MDLSLRFISKIIVELTIQNNSTTVTKDIAKSDGSIPLEFIENLKDIVERLEEHNKYL